MSTTAVEVSSTSSLGESGSPARWKAVYCADVYYRHIPTIDNFNIQDLNPFELEDRVFFPEWYYCFKEKFSKAVPTGRDYCTLSYDEYKSRFFGGQYVINQVPCSVYLFFVDCLRDLLEGKRFGQDFEHFTREYIENETIPNIDMESLESRVKITARQDLLKKWAVQGNYMPLLNHLLAFSSTPQTVWKFFIEAFASKFRKLTRSQKKDFIQSITDAQEIGTGITNQIRSWYEEMQEDMSPWRPK
ncbi:hypothetical protein EJF18_40022 [Clavispora lusitaniae]|uniref:Uncharacterized protein n=2 Tax=Clavispora lusitaniae TaxID=36911 RepID=C4Y4Y2_CLAL4|nr:uncharacterized protein CLUG_03216 [Clavispora lusitaniae ATCC 42720]QFZ28000.1 hypothetical protein EJF14_40022 [Clavispora lusitaniae]EEQ39088.1 predicted protein [Clavispora lusitaniae ATCC 42720]QFZ33664.1 hypothetical protein EJF16_40022 [Clavispora lusitaniae]QFZ39335.1 hypothetical protein EJF15_40022 [Clavispora lusitaniae]QFZ45017.1 hypothetical protein EJF18_40022 [Clavispora lusitaniae]